MSYHLAFDNLLLYDAGRIGIAVPVLLHIGGQAVNLEAKLDTGSSHCIFQRFAGDQLGLDVEGGYRTTIHTATGSFIAFGHQVALAVFDLNFDSLVYFAKDEGFSRDVLGRHGFLDKVRVGIRDYQGELYLSRNDS